MSDPPPNKATPVPRKPQEARNLLDLGRATPATPLVTQLAPGLTQREAALLREPGRQFGRYALLEEVGRGGMGVVYRAWDLRLRRVVALKMAAQTSEAGTTRTMGEGHPSFERLIRVDPDLMARLQREAQAASRLAHPNLIRVLDAGVFDGIFYFTMDLVSGVSVADMPMPMPEKDALRLAARIARGVAHAHEQGVLHRDIKPSNIIVSERGEPVLIDFGLARDLAVPSSTVTGDVFGTPCYMAPEQAEGDPKKVTRQTDVYGLGATLYHLLTGKAPYGDLEAGQVLLAVVSHPPYPATTLNPMISRRAERIVARAMARAPGDRYASADAMADDIEACLGVRPDVDPTGRTVVLAEAREPVAAFSPRARLAWAWVLGVAAVFLLGVGFAVWRSDLRQQEPPVESRAVVEAPPRRDPPPTPDTAPKSDPPEPTIPKMGPPRVAPPTGLGFDATARLRPTPRPPRATDTPPPIERPVPPPDPPPPPDPDAGVPDEARALLGGAIEAFDKALAMPLTERPAEARANLGEAVALADRAAARAPTWPKPKRLRGDVLLTLGLYPDAVRAYAEYASLRGSPARPAEALLAEFLEWFRTARPWAEEVTPTAASKGEALADRLTEAASAEGLEVSPFLPWRPGAAVDATAGLKGAREDLAVMASMARQDWGGARDRARRGRGGIASYVAEVMGWVAVDWVRPDAVIVEMTDRRVRCPEAWLVTSWGNAWAGDFEGAERAAVRALEARDAGTPEVAHQLGVIAYRKDDLERAKNEWIAALGADPERRVYHLDVGAVCLLRGELTEAEARLKGALAKGTHADPATARMRGFAEYGIACADARRVLEVTPRPKKRERDRLYADAVSRVRSCLAAAGELPRSKDRTAQAAPRSYYEWYEDNVRHWIRADPWTQALRDDAGTWKQIEALLK